MADTQPAPTFRARFQLEKALTDEGNVFLVFDTAVQERVVIKCLPHCIYLNDDDRIDCVNKVKRTAIVHKELHHSCVTRFYQIWGDASYFYFAMEYVPGGNLYDYLLRRDGFRLHSNEARVIIHDVAEGISHVHSKTAAHRSIEARHVLLTQEGRAKICDFSLSRFRPSNCTTKLTSSIYYIAPEVWERAEYDGRKADTWSCGVLLYFMLFGMYPYFVQPTEDEEQTRVEFRNLVQATEVVIPQEPRIPKRCKKLLLRMLRKVPEERITIEEMLENEWFTPVPVQRNLQPIIPEAVQTTQEITSELRRALFL